MKAFANRRGPRAVTLTLFLGFAGCPGTGEYTNTGEEGSRPAQRIVSLVPSVTEVLLELGAAERLVARTDSDESPALAHLPSVGDVLTPNLEAIVASEPDLVVAWSGIDTSPLERAMSGGGRVRTTSIDRLADIDRAIRDVGSWIDEEVAAEELRRSFTATLRAADRTVTDGERPSVLWVVWSDPIVVAGPATFLSDLIDLVGGCNAAMQAGSRWPQLGPEPLLSLDPDVLVWSEGAGMFPKEQLLHRMPWSRLFSVGSNRVITFQAARFNVPGPRIATAALDLARSLDDLERRRANH